jgi:LysR family transcriptional activator of nhaA
LTETGRIVYRYAEEIFSLGRELVDAVKDRPTGKPLRVVVGVADVLSKLVVRRLLAPALQLPEPVRLVCREDRHERLLAELAIHGLDLVLADAPVPPGSRIRAFNHLLGECGVTFFGHPPLAERLRTEFPQALDGAPMLLPLETLPIRRALDHWFESVGVRPRIVGEFEDSALMKVFGSEGLGLFPAPDIVEEEICRRYGVNVVGRVHEVRERFYAISVERRIQNPAAVAICNSARRLLGDSG